jgi:putative membrane protein
VIKRKDLKHLAQGFLMGGADIIPGVSGGTVALILQIYERLVTAISRFNLTLVTHLRRGNWTGAAAYVDLRFIIYLGCGIAIGVGGLASVMRYLLEHHLQPTHSAFFGLILASSVLVARMIGRWGVLSAVGLLLGAGFAYWLVGQLPAKPPEGNAYLFICGMIAICAMILPGISGAFILLILGKYDDMTGLLSRFLHGNITLETTTTLVVFLSGCVLGLLSFGKLLNWMLDRHKTFTMAVLCGFMVGSLRKIWPFKRDLTPEITENILPDSLNWDVWLSLGLAVAAAAFVFALDWLTSGHVQEPLPHHGSLNLEEIASRKNGKDA